MVDSEGTLAQTIFDNGPAITAQFKVAQDFIDYKQGVYQTDACNT